MTFPNAQTILAGMAMVILGALAGVLAFHPVPQGNQTQLTYILGALSGALTVGGVGKLADKITNSKSDTATIQPDGQP